MLEHMTIFQTARSLAEHAAAGQAITARNVANADTPGYRAQGLHEFSEVFENATRIAMRTTRPGHVGGATSPYTPQAVTTHNGQSPNGNSVQLDREMVRAAEYRHQHDLALAVYKSALTTLRTSIQTR